MLAAGPCARATSGPRWRRRPASRSCIAASCVIARRPEAVPVLEAFLRDRDGRGLRAARPPARRARRFPVLARRARRGGAMEPARAARRDCREAIPRLAAWLAEAHGVDLPARRRRCVRSSRRRSRPRAGRIEAEAAVVCPGDDLLTPVPRADRRLRGDPLQAAHAARRAAGAGLAPAGRGDVRPQPGALSRLCRAARGAAAARAARARAAASISRNGVHLIVVQSADGSLVVGDSHHYAATPDPFAPEAVDDLILDEYRRAVAPEPPRCWSAGRASTRRPTGLMFVRPACRCVRLVMVTSGTGASTAFAIGEEIDRATFSG